MASRNQLGARGAWFGAVLSAMAAPSSGLAQVGSAPSSGQPHADAAVGEVVVTARKRAEKLQDIPIAMSAVSGAALQARGAVKLEDIANFTPNITFENNPSFGGASSSAAIYIRGIGQKEFLPTTEPGVGVYVDGVYIARSVGADLDLVDIDHVEVLRGPQGTLFGRNTIGGAISVTTHKPSDTPEASAEVTTGAYDRIDSKAMISGPLTSDLFAKLSIAEMKRDGYVDHVADGRDLGDVNTLTGRFDLRWKPSSTFEANFSVEATRDHTHGPAITLAGIDFNSTVFNPQNLPLLPPGSPATAGYYVANPPKDAPTDNFSLLSNYEAYYLGGQPCLTAKPYNPGGANAAACYNSRFVSETKNYGTSPEFSRNDVIAGSATLDWDLGAVHLKSITAYRNLKGEYARDGDDSPLNIVSFYDNLKDQQFSQEFQLLGALPDQHIKYVAGLYFYNDEGNDINLLSFTPVDFQSGGSYVTTSYAAFGQAIWSFLPTWDLTVGLRYTDDQKSFTPDQFITADRTPGMQLIAADPNTPNTLVLPFATVKRDDGNVSPMANLAWHVDKDLMIYASVSQGFKSGGFVQRVFPPLPETPQFAPETATSYEVGVKSTWLDRRLTVNASVFYTDYENLQVQVFTGVAPVTKNAAAATIEGAELESRYNIGDGWLLEGSAGYLDPKYTKVNPEAIEITTASKFERISTWSLSASLSKTVDLGDYGDLTGRVDWSYRTGYYMDALNTPELYQSGYALVNASLIYDLPGHRWSVAVGATNLTNTHYEETGIYDTTFGQYEKVWSRPSEWYLKIKWKM